MYLVINMTRASVWVTYLTITFQLLIKLCSKITWLSSYVNNGRSSDKSDRFYVAVGHLKIEIQLMSDQIFVQLENISYCYKNIKTFLSL